MKHKCKDLVDGLQEQAKRMRQKSDANFPNPSVGDTVCIPIPAVDRGKTDPRSILACVMEVTRDKLYRLRTHDGIFNCFYAHSQCRFCHEKFVEVEKIPTTYISLRTTSLLEVEDRVLFDAIAQLSVQPARRLNVYAAKKGYFVIHGVIVVIPARISSVDYS